MDQEINGRIKQILDYEEMSPANFASEIGISRSNLAHILSGRNQPSFTMLEKVMRAFPEIRSEWLITGLGNMVKGAGELAATKAALDQKRRVESNQSKLEFVDDLFSSAVVSQEIGETPTSSTMPKSNKVNELAPSPTPLEQGSQRVQNAIYPDHPSVVTEKALDFEKISGKAAPIHPAPRARQRTDRREGIEKRIRKIVFFYSDNSFEEFYPQ